MGKRKSKLRDANQVKASARRLLKTTRVKLHFTPDWFRRKLLELVGKDDQMYDDYTVVVYGMRKAGCSCWLDHFGSMKVDGGTAFVSEPYTVDSEILQSAEEFAKLLGVRHYVSANSWWNPGETFRIVFLPPDDPDAAEASP